MVIARFLALVIVFGATINQAVAVEIDEPEVVAVESHRAAAQTKAPWSDVVDGLQARIALRHTRVLNGTPVIRPYLELRNTDDVATPLKLPFATDQLKFKVVDAAGKERLADGLSYSGGGGFKADLVIPFKGTLSFAIAYGGCGVLSDMTGLIDLGPLRCYLFKPDEGEYFLQTVLEVPDTRPDAERAWHGCIELPRVLIPRTVAQPDPNRVAALIDELGAKMVQRPYSYESEAAEQSLSLIADKRVIPWYVKAMDSDRYNLKFAALDRLSRFEGDEAFAALSKGITTQGRDIGSSSTPEVASQMAENIRHAAAARSLRSPHSDAKRLLLNKWEDPSTAVRITILHELGRMTTDDSLALLKKMSEDSDEQVRSEARRYVKLRTEAQKAPANPSKTN